MNTREEARLLGFKNEVMKLTEEYISSTKLSSNLSASQKEGLTSLQKKCKEEGVVVRETDLVVFVALVINSVAMKMICLSWALRRNDRIAQNLGKEVFG